MVINDFHADLAWSHEQSDLHMWEQVYRSAFPTFASMRTVKQYGWAQLAGIDRLIDLRDGTSLKVDEKSRRQSWSDVLLEVWSSEERKTPGWMEKDLSIDYLAYAFIPDRTCYLLPYQSLRRAWIQHRDEWIERYRPVRAKNPGYTTVSVAVPISVLLEAIKNAMIVYWVSPVDDVPF